MKTPPTETTTQTPATGTEQTPLRLESDALVAPLHLPVDEQVVAPLHVNSVDATAGQPMVDRIAERKRELEALLADLDKNDTGTRRDIDEALATIGQLLTGDLTHVPPMVTIEMNRWLERHKHLGERAAPASTISV